MPGQSSISDRLKNLSTQLHQAIEEAANSGRYYLALIDAITNKNTHAAMLRNSDFRQSDLLEKLEKAINGYTLQLTTANRNLELYLGKTKKIVTFKPKYSSEELIGPSVAVQTDPIYDPKQVLEEYKRKYAENKKLKEAKEAERKATAASNPYLAPESESKQNYSDFMYPYGLYGKGHRPHDADIGKMLARDGENMMLPDYYKQMEFFLGHKKIPTGKNNQKMITHDIPDDRSEVNSKFFHSQKASIASHIATTGKRPNTLKYQGPKRTIAESKIDKHFRVNFSDDDQSVSSHGTIRKFSGRVKNNKAPSTITDEYNPVYQIEFINFTEKTGRTIVLGRVNHKTLSIHIFGINKTLENSFDLNGLDIVPLGLETFELKHKEVPDDLSADIDPQKDEAVFKDYKIYIIFVFKEIYKGKDRVTLQYIAPAEKKFKPLVCSSYITEGTANYLRIKTSPLTSNKGYLELVFLIDRLKFIYTKFSDENTNWMNEIKHSSKTYDGSKVKEVSAKRSQVVSSGKVIQDFCFDLSPQRDDNTSLIAILERDDMDEFSKFKVYICKITKNEKDNFDIARIDGEHYDLRIFNFMDPDVKNFDPPIQKALKPADLFMFYNLAYSSREGKVTVMGLSATQLENVPGSKKENWAVNLETRVAYRGSDDGVEGSVKVIRSSFKHEFVLKFLRDNKLEISKTNLRKYMTQLKAKTIITYTPNYVLEMKKGDTIELREGNLLNYGDESRYEKLGYKNHDLITMYTIFYPCPYIYMLFSCYGNYVHFADFRYTNFDLSCAREDQGDQPYYDFRKLPDGYIQQLGNPPLKPGEISIKAAYSRNKITSVVNIRGITRPEVIGRINHCNTHEEVGPKPADLQPTNQ